MFISARLFAKGVVNSSDSAKIAKETERVAAEKFITASLLSSALLRKSFTNFDFGSFVVKTKKESAAMRDSDRILMAIAARLADNILISALCP